MPCARLETAPSHKKSATDAASARPVPERPFGVTLYLLALTAFSSWASRKATPHGRDLLDEEEDSDECDASYPDWLENGGVALFFLGILYLFLGIALVCESYFVPSLREISKRLGLSEDVTGATFMAAGSSAPELFASLMALTNDDAANDIGVGTIVGSAVFNILVIIGVTALFSERTLELDYKPIARDGFFYTAAICTVIGVFYDGKVYWWEGLISVGLYVLYVLAVRYNRRLLDLLPDLDLHGAKQPDEAKQNLIENGDSAQGGAEADVEQPALVLENGQASCSEPPQIAPSSQNPSTIEESSRKEFLERAMWIVYWPWEKAFAYSIPPCFKEGWERFYILTFFASIVWIGAISWFMVGWASKIGCILGIPSAIMGVTILAAGTSVPDALSSVMVAKQGLGDMAVANAVGSNVFDIWLGLGLPWLVAIPFRKDDSDHRGAFIEVDNDELLPSVLILLGILLLYILSLTFTKMKLDPKAGYLFLAIYAVYALYYVIFVWALDIYDS